jgi:hypothetical protein
MPALRELQRAFGSALFDTVHPRALSALADQLGVESSLLAIYRNTALSTLTAALGLSFPAVKQLVGAEFFEAAAREFISTHAPERACLNDYGADFPLFLAQFPPAASVGYLADVARLEWAVNRALHAPDVPPLQLDALGRLDANLMPQVSFVAHPAVSVLRLAMPADAIWRSVLERDEAAMAAVDLACGPIWLLIERNAEGVQVRRLTAVSGRFSERLCAGEPLQTALQGDGLAGVLAEHLAAGRFTSWHYSAGITEN